MKFSEIIDKDNSATVGSVRIISSSSVARRAKVLVGNQIIPYKRAVIDLSADDFITVTLEVRVDAIDVEALQQFTTIKLAEDA